MVDPANWEAVDQWRKHERQRLIAERLAIPAETRAELAKGIIDGLEKLVVEARPEPIISVYHPFRGEPDLRGWMADLTARGVRVALPIVAQRDAPMEFRLWTPDGQLERGVLGIPVPADTETVAPDIVIAPCLGFDGQNYRLGYGGGYFDRTLAARSPKPLAIGIGFSRFRLETIYPQPHDVAMDWIVTEEDVCEG